MRRLESVRAMSASRVRTKSGFRPTRAHNGEIGALNTVTPRPFVPSTSNKGLTSGRVDEI